MKTALLLIAHGSRNAEANADLVALADGLRESAEYPIVEPAYLELAQPTIDDAGRKCVMQGAECVILLPYFLSPGVHARIDLQVHCDRLASTYADVTFLLAKPIGAHPLLTEIVLQRARECKG